MQPFMYPTATEMRGVLSINQGAYCFWNARKQTVIIKKELGWEGRKVEGSYVDWDNVECSLIGVRDYIKYLRRGFGRSAQLASADIRNGFMTRDKAMGIIKEYDGKRPGSLDYFLKIVEMDEDKFTKIAYGHKVTG